MWERVAEWVSDAVDDAVAFIVRFAFAGLVFWGIFELLRTVLGR